ncbi:Galactose oxidase/kelch beta-propeller [Arabidopsis thaliana x Arabidopsis arenosa]|nr:Galactose oxidase/kelch beta-propeller [Arabidopsis thaliana x Arabidopsis arenosa]
MGWIPRWYDGKRDLCQSKPSLTTSSSMELDEKEDVDMMTMVNDDDDDDKRVSSLSKVMRLISGISPYAQSLFKKKGKILGKRLMIEEETESNMMMDEPNSSKFLDVERINKRRRVKPNHVYQFEITTGDSCWRLSETTITCNPSVPLADKKPVYFDGCIHWLRKDGSILAFNPETEQARLIPIKFPLELSAVANKFLFEATEKELALISATEESINVYSLEAILIDPKWVLVKEIQNGVLHKKTMRCWNVAAYNGKCLVLWQMNKVACDGDVFGYDLRANKWEVIGWIPEWCDGYQVFYLFKPSFSSAIELKQKVDVETMNMVHGDDCKYISTLRKLMSLIEEISPYAKRLFKKKGKRLMTEEETKLKMTVDEPSSSKCLDVMRFSKKRRFLGMEKINKRKRPVRSAGRSGVVEGFVLYVVTAQYCRNTGEKLPISMVFYDSVFDNMHLLP